MLRDCGRGVCKEELVARSIEVDAERAGYGEGRDTEWDAWVGLLAETKGIRLSPARGDRLSAFSEVGVRPKGNGHVDVRRGVKGLGDDGVNVERGLLDLLGKEGPWHI